MAARGGVRRLAARGLAAVAMTAAAALTAAGCQSAESKKQASANSDQPVKIGVSLPLTGMFSIPGQNHKKGYQLCADQINAHGGMLGRKVQLIVRDNRSDTETVVNQTQRFLSVDKVDFLLGTFSTLLAFPSESIAEQNKKVYLEPSDSAFMSHSRGLKYNFGFTLKPIDLIGQTPVDAVSDFVGAGDIKGADAPKTAAIIYQDDFFPDSITRGLIGGKLEIPGTGKSVDFGKGYLADKGIKVVYKRQFPGDFNDWTSLASQVKSSGADMLFALTTPPAEVNIVKAMRTVAYKPKGAFFSQGTYDEFKKSLGDAVNGIMVWSTWSPEAQWQGTLNGKPYGNQDFVRDFQAKFHQPADEDMAQAFTVCQALANAVYATKTTDNTKIRDWLASRSASDPVKTIQGDYHFDDKGLTADRDVLLLQWQHGELRFIYPKTDVLPDVAKVEWPMPNW
jgi:branched-chain amino acid transport system substrate-binding protein